MLALGVIIISGLLPVAQVSANGVHVGSTEVFSGPVGPYSVRVQTVPVVGNMHMTIYVEPSVGPNPVSETKVQVMAKGPRDAPQTVGPVLATGTLDGPNWYAVNLPIEQAGEWVFTLTVGSSLGEGAVDFPIKVQKSGGVDWGLIAVVVLALGLAIWITRSWKRGERGTGRRPRPDSRV